MRAIRTLMSSRRALTGRGINRYHDIRLDRLIEFRLETPTHRRVDRHARIVPDRVLDSDQVKQRELSSRLHIDQQVQVAVLAVVAGGTGAEHRDMRDAAFPQHRPEPTDALDESVAVHGYSAASRGA